MNSILIHQVQNFFARRVVDFRALSKRCFAFNLDRSKRWKQNWADYNCQALSNEIPVFKLKKLTTQVQFKTKLYADFFDLPSVSQNGGLYIQSFVLIVFVLSPQLNLLKLTFTIGLEGSGGKTFHIKRVEKTSQTVLI